MGPFQLGWGCPFRLGCEGRRHLSGCLNSEEPALAEARAESLRPAVRGHQQTRESGRVQVVYGLAGHGREFGFYPSSSRDPYDRLKPGNSMIWLPFCVGSERAFWYGLRFKLESSKQKMLIVQLRFVRREILHFDQQPHIKL